MNLVGLPIECRIALGGITGLLAAAHLHQHLGDGYRVLQKDDLTSSSPSTYTANGGCDKLHA